MNCALLSSKTRKRKRPHRQAMGRPGPEAVRAPEGRHARRGRSDHERFPVPMHSTKLAVPQKHIRREEYAETRSPPVNSRTNSAGRNAPSPPARSVVARTPLGIKLNSAVRNRNGVTGDNRTLLCRRPKGHRARATNINARSRDTARCTCSTPGCRRSARFRSARPRSHRN